MTAAGRSGQAGLRPVLTARPKLTGRAAVLAIVLCAIALTLAYPVREYIADRRQIDQLAASNQRLAAEVRHLHAQSVAMNSPAAIEQEARDSLHMCFPAQTCYEVIVPVKHHVQQAPAPARTPWYGKLWESVRKADHPTAR